MSSSWNLNIYAIAAFAKSLEYILDSLTKLISTKLSLTATAKPAAFSAAAMFSAISAVTFGWGRYLYRLYISILLWNV